MEWKSVSGEHVLLVVHSYQARCLPSSLPSDALRCLQLPWPYLAFLALSKYLFCKLFPPFSGLPLPLPLMISLTVKELLSSISHLSIFAFVVCALGIRATEPCLGALFCSQFLHTASGPSLPNSSSIFRARGVLSCGCSFRMWCQLCRVPSSHGNPPNSKSSPWSPASSACVLFLLCLFLLC